MSALYLTERTAAGLFYWSVYRVFSHDLMIAVVSAPQINGTAAKFVSQTVRL